MTNEFSTRVVEDWLGLRDSIDNNQKRIFSELESQGESLCAGRSDASEGADRDRPSQFLVGILPYAVSVIQWATPENIVTALQRASDEAGPGADPAGLVAVATLLYLLERGYSETKGEYEAIANPSVPDAAKQRQLQSRLERWESMLDHARGAV